MVQNKIRQKKGKLNARITQDHKVAQINIALSFLVRKKIRKQFLKTSIIKTKISEEAEEVKDLVEEKEKTTMIRQQNVVEEGKDVVIGDVVAREITQRTQKPQMTTKHRYREVVEDRDVAGEVAGADKI